MINTEHATPELFSAFIAAQSEIENATKNAQNSHLKNKYADLNEVLSVIKPVFAKHKLGFMQFPGFDGSLASITTVISNEKGAYLTATASCVPAKSDAQAIGSASTYLRRYSLAGMVGIYQEDDDGESAKHDCKPEPVRQQQPRQQVAPAKADPNHPNIVKVKQVIDEIINIAELSDKHIEDKTKWARELVTREAKALQLSIKSGDIERITEGAMDILIKRVQDTANKELAPEPANA